MNIKKSLLVGAVGLVAALGLSGCMKMDATITVSPDAKMESMTFVMTSEDPIMRDMLTVEALGEDARGCIDIEDGVKCSQTRAELAAEDPEGLAEFEKSITVLDSGALKMTIPGNSNGDGGGAQQIAEAAAMGVETSLTVVMPYEVESATLGGATEGVVINGNSATIDMMVSPGDVVVTTVAPSSAPPVALIALIAAAGIGMIGYFLFGRKKDEVAPVDAPKGDEV